MRERITTFLAVLALAATSQAGDPAATFDGILGDLPSGWEAAGLEARANVGGASAFRIGERMSYHFRTAQDAHLVVVHRDSFGVANVIVPGPLAPDAALRAGDELSIEGLSAVAPVGHDILYVIATREPLDAQGLGLSGEPDELRTYDAESSGDLAQRLADAVAGLPAGDVAVTRIEYDVLGRGDIEYTVDDVVAQLTPTRSVQRPKMSFHKVGFGFNSTDLSEKAQRNLDVIGQALKSSHLTRERFVLGGHTDDIGPAGYNKQLSERRAAAAKQYLIQKWGVDPERIVTRGYGEDKPAVEGMSDTARERNRRVELEVIR